MQCLILRISVPNLTQCCSVHLTNKILELELEQTQVGPKLESQTLLTCVGFNRRVMWAWIPPHVFNL